MSNALSTARNLQPRAPGAGIKVVPGDLILFTKNAGTDLRLGGEDYLILDPAGLLAVIKTAAI